ncbi:MAG: hypothetical protein M1826_002452 [Phylliscum demangeonii]|nr:MAG: hypothetical protein M1826_002452 [Phylliscum demangeonii]
MAAYPAPTSTAAVASKTSLSSDLTDVELAPSLLCSSSTATLAPILRDHAVADAALLPSSAGMASPPTLPRPAAMANAQPRAYVHTSIGGAGNYRRRPLNVPNYSLPNPATIHPTIHATDPSSPRPTTDEHHHQASNAKDACTGAPAPLPRPTSVTSVIGAAGNLLLTVPCLSAVVPRTVSSTRSAEDHRVPGLETGPAMAAACREKPRQYHHVGIGGVGNLAPKLPGPGTMTVDRGRPGPATVADELGDAYVEGRRAPVAGADRLASWLLALCTPKRKRQHRRL